MKLQKMNSKELHALLTALLTFTESGRILEQIELLKIWIRKKGAAGQS